MSYDLEFYPYPLSYLPSDGGVVPKELITGDPSATVPDQDNWYIICCNPDEMLALMSSVWIGAVIHSPDTYNSIFQILLQAYQNVNSFNGAPCVELCQLILDCINNTPELQQAIASYSLGSSIESTTPEQQEILDRDLFDSPSGCDNDNIFGMTLQLTDYLNIVSEDILELFVTAFATPGRIGDIIEAIPGLGVLPYDDILQFFEKVATTVNDAYQAAYDTQIREDIACDLFCLAQASCTLTLETARDYFQSKFVNAVTNQDFAKFVNDIIGNNWLGEH